MNSAPRTTRRATSREILWEDIAPLVDEALNQLDPDHRDLVIRHYLQGTSQSALATDLGLNQSTVSRRLEQAAESLRSHFKKTGLTASLLMALLAANAKESGQPHWLDEIGKMALTNAAFSASSTATAGAGAG